MIDILIKIAFKLKPIKLLIRRVMNIVDLVSLTEQKLMISTKQEPKFKANILETEHEVLKAAEIIKESKIISIDTEGEDLSRKGE